ncbi:MAG: helix-turn-helix domain-containing protein [Halobacteriota archaeon]|nr:helix-turn-helix domain-containing protein [Halobacteriota archaeon]
MCEESNCQDRSGCLCPVRGIIDIVSKKWTMCIVSHLDIDKPLRYNEIKNGIGSISPKSLSDTLKLLEKEGLIKRVVYPETPPRVEYLLTEDGRDLKVALMPLLGWVQESEGRSS